MKNRHFQQMIGICKKKNQIHILELRNTIYKIKNSLDMLTTDLTKQKGLVNSKTSQ